MPRKKIDVPQDDIKMVADRVNAAIGCLNNLAYTMVKNMPESIQSSIELAGRQLLYAKNMTENMLKSKQEKRTIKKTKDTLKKLSDVELQPEDHE